MDSLKKRENLVNILWTSGWDSTFRILQLAKKGISIQPYYVIDTRRKSTLVEIETMNRIKDMILKKWSYTEGLIRPTKYIEINDITKLDYVTQSYHQLRKKAFMGSQYEWLGWLSKSVEQLELCIHKDDKAHYFIKDFTVLENNFKGEYYKVDKFKADNITVDVFGSYSFPILEYTKIEMLEEAKKEDFYDIMVNTWFCFSPINGEACGMCNPCKYAIEEGMEFRFTKKSLKRYENRNKNKILKKIKSLIRNSIK